MPINKKAVVISNCQCLPIAAALTTLAADTTFDFWGVHLIAPSERERAIAQFVTMARDQYEMIVTIPLSEEFGVLSSELIGTTLQVPIVKISNIYFSGLHPDLCYIGGLGERVVGPLIDYHSKIALYGYLKEYPLKRILSLFNTEVYERAGFYSEYDGSMLELRQRDQEVDVAVSDILPALLKEQLCLFSVNHPTPSLVMRFAHEVLLYMERLGLVQRSGLPPDVNYCTESLAGNCVFPVYPEIAARHGVYPLGSYWYKASGSRVNLMNLPQFVAAELACFARSGVQALQRTYTGQLTLEKMSFLHH